METPTCHPSPSLFLSFSLTFPRAFLCHFSRRRLRRTVPNYGSLFPLHRGSSLFLSFPPSLSLSSHDLSLSPFSIFYFSYFIEQTRSGHFQATRTGQGCSKGTEMEGRSSKAVNVSRWTKAEAHETIVFSWQ